MTINITRGKIQAAQKVVVYGSEGVGKTTFAAQFPNPLFIDTEAGTQHYDVARVDPAPQSWTALMQTIKAVKAERPCSTLVLDTADWAEAMAMAHVCAENKWPSIETPGYGAGYTALREEFGKLLNNLSDVAESGINVVVTAHAAMRKFDQPDEAASYDRWELKLQRKVAPLLKEWADAVLFADYKTVVETVAAGMGQVKGKARGGSKRVMRAQHHACWDAKNRWGLADEVPFDYAQIAAFIPGTPPAKQVTLPAVAPQEPIKPAAPAVAVSSGPAQQAKPVQTIVYGKDGNLVSDTRKTKAQALPDYWAPALQLMDAIGATVDDVRAVAVAKGHVTPETPPDKFGKDYIDGCIVPQWPKFVEEINSARAYNAPVPFN
ncbi:MAG: ATP-binding protein [Gordonibacter sp.]|uniref:ATP-binding protein n=1 Tax=Gordonibacter sp. TaxID=1968902 RepID=UPI002FC8E1CE